MRLKSFCPLRSSKSHAELDRMRSPPIFIATNPKKRKRQEIPSEIPVVDSRRAERKTYEHATGFIAGVEGRRRYQGGRLRPREIDKVCHRESSPLPLPLSSSQSPPARPRRGPLAPSRVNSTSQLFSNRKLLEWAPS